VFSLQFGCRRPPFSLVPFPIRLYCVPLADYGSTTDSQIERICRRASAEPPCATGMKTLPGPYSRGSLRDPQLSPTTIDACAREAEPRWRSNAWSFRCSRHTPCAVHCRRKRHTECAYYNGRGNSPVVTGVPPNKVQSVIHALSVVGQWHTQTCSLFKVSAISLALRAHYNVPEAATHGSQFCARRASQGKLT